MAESVLSIGQCGADSFRLSRVVKAELGLSTTDVDDADAALELLRAHTYALVLVNRILDGDGSSGVELIGKARAGGCVSPMMLVSDYEDAQAQAVANGALPGFGKSSLAEAGPLLRAARKRSGV